MCDRNYSADTKVSEEEWGGGAPGRSPPAARAGGCPKTSLTPWKGHTGAGFWQDL